MTEIRLAQLKDIPILRKVAIEVQYDTFGDSNSPEIMEAFIQENFTDDKLTQEFAEPGSQYFMAWDGADVAGFMRLRVTDEVETHLGPNALEIQRLYVMKRHQGKKIGGMLMQLALDYGRTRGFEWIWLGVWEKNIKAQKFYGKWGFEHFGEHVFWMGPDPQNDYLLKLKL
jgi:ribosomal protein S18 acetylase RimI-like enzyme